MGFLSTTRKLGNQIFDINIGGWLGYNSIKTSTKNIVDDTKENFHVEHAEIIETFSDAMLRLNITEDDLKARKIEFTRLFFIFLIVTAAVFLYGLFIAIVHKNIIGFFITMGLTCFSLSQAFKYHFWLYQIKARRLGCTLKEWYNSDGVE